MSIDKHDPRLTAYALGEMDAAESAAFEAELDDAARTEIEAIRQVAGRVESEWRDTEVVLTAAQRARIESPRSRAWLFPAAAAALLVTVVLAALTSQTHTAAKETVAREAATARKERDKDRVAIRSDAGDLKIKANPSTGVVHKTLESKPKTSTTAADLLLEELSLKSKKWQKEVNDRERPNVINAPPGGRGPEAVTSASPLHFSSKKRFTRTLEDDLRRPRAHNTEGYDRIRDNPFVSTADEHTSTFSIDVDTASYSNVRRYLSSGKLPPKDAVRIEELINYFSYDYEPPRTEAKHPFRAQIEIAGCPWNTEHRLARIALKGKVMSSRTRPATNLVFLVDVSGSMRPANKLPLLKQAMALLTRELRERDRVAIVVYAGAAGLVLPSTTGAKRHRILAALERLQSGGSTNGGAGIQLAYDIAARNFIKGGVNRVILATDGDFNVGTTDRGSLTRLIEDRAKSGVYLSVLGFGQGNYKDDRMEELSNKGNGNYAYIDTLKEARKVLVEQMNGTLVTIAKDVKIQIFFNPRRVAAYRLIGYENRMLQKQDFNDDTKDAGEIGAGHAVTVLYELVPAGSSTVEQKTDQNPFVGRTKASAFAARNALFRLQLRYKQPDGETSTLMNGEDVTDGGLTFDNADRDFQWAASVAAFGMLLRESPHRGEISWKTVLEIAKAAMGGDRYGYRAEFVGLVGVAERLSPLPKEPGPKLAVIRSIKGNLVVISIGSKDGVQAGDTYEIRRADLYVGQVTVTNVYKDRSVATFDTEYKGPGAPPQVNDTAERPER